MTDKELQEQYADLNRHQRDSIEKYTYFLLASVGAAIAFSIQRSEDKQLGWNLLPLGLALLAWGFSFYYGCKQLVHKRNSIAANIQGISYVENAPAEKKEQFAIEVNATFYLEVKRASRSGRQQFRCFILGVICFVLWHVLELFLKTYPNTCLSQFIL